MKIKKKYFKALLSIVTILPTLFIPVLIFNLQNNPKQITSLKQINTYNLSTDIREDVKSNGIKVNGEFASRTVEEILANPSNKLFLEQAQTFIYNNFNDIIVNYQTIVEPSFIEITNFSDSRNVITNSIQVGFKLAKSNDSNGSVVTKQFSIIVYGFNEQSQNQTTGKTVSAIELSKLTSSNNLNFTNYHSYYAQEFSSNGSLNSKFVEDLTKLINENPDFFFENPPTTSTTLPMVKKNTKPVVSSYSIGNNKNALIVSGTFLSIPKNPLTPVDENSYRNDMQIVITDFSLNKTIAKQNIVADERFSSYTAEYIHTNLQTDFKNWILSMNTSYFLLYCPNDIQIKGIESIQLNDDNTLSVILQVVNSANSDGSINRGIANIAIMISGFNYPTITTSIKFNYQTIDVRKIDDESPFEMDYLNVNFKSNKEELIRSYINDNYQDIFNELPNVWKPELTKVEILQKNRKTIASATIYGLDDGNLVDNLKLTFNLEFKSPDLTRLIDVVKNSAQRFVQEWPEWNNQKILSFYTKIKQDISSSIYNNPSLFPKTITSSVNEISDMIYLDTNKFEFTNNSISIGSKAISINSENNQSLVLIGTILIKRGEKEFNRLILSWPTIAIIVVSLFIVIILILILIFYLRRKRFSKRRKY